LTGINARFFSRAYSCAMAATEPARTSDLVQALARALRAQLLETHISWVLLAGDTAYKIKKPLCLPFVDYSTLDSRRHFCEEELRLNRRLAPSLYLGVTRITGEHQAPRLDGAGPVLEYAVRMRRFPAGALFDEQIAAGTLQPHDIDRLAAVLARFHRQAPRAPAPSGFASAERRHAAALAALGGVQSIATPAELASLRHWLDTEARALHPLWTARLADGWVRECHGDLHLANLVRLDGDVVAFDCIEFDPALRWIDVIDDVAFIVMDFEAHHRRDFAFRFLNAWLDRTGAHGGLPALRFAVVYRALIRAQVTSLRNAADDSVARRYLQTALAWMSGAGARLVITHGLSGSGKTVASQRLLERAGAIRLRSDVERKRLFGLEMTDDSRSQGLTIYDTATTARTYATLFGIARDALKAGYPVIVDAAFLRRTERAQALALARGVGVPFSILHCEAPTPVLRERLQARRGDASEANVAVLEHQLEIAEPLSADELTHTELAGVTAASSDFLPPTLPAGSTTPAPD
jgi:uncharacterized protein